jgi:L-threonylcarbamoyladenylate synthase
MNLPIDRAADVLLGGGVIAYPTEGVFGLGCMPDDLTALARVIEIKQRDPAKGLILIAAKHDQLKGWVAEEDLERLPAPDPERPTTWVAKSGPNVGVLLRGDHAGIAVRLTTNATAAAICDKVDSPITSTSANLANSPVARNRIALIKNFGALVDYVVPGDCGPASGPSEIRNLEDGSLLRPGNQ